ncbi:MAG TPA: hypothetical protein VGJ95_17880 [Pseudonocardiaceae bacterium]|jgi:hypothetical protein
MQVERVSGKAAEGQPAAQLGGVGKPVRIVYAGGRDVAQAAVAALAADGPGPPDDELTVGIMRVVGLASVHGRNGHTGALVCRGGAGQPLSAMSASTAQRVRTGTPVPPLPV